MTTESPNYFAPASRREAEPPPPPPAAEPEAPKNAYGIAGLVAGGVGLLVSWIPMVGLLCTPLGLTGLALSALGLARFKRGEATNRTVSLAGVAVSALGVVVALVMLAVLGISSVVGGKLSYPADADEKHRVEFVVTVTTATHVNYGAHDELQEDTIPPGTWRQTASYDTGGFPLKLVLDAPTNAGDRLLCTILLDGNVVASLTTDASSVKNNVSCTAQAN
ncbi:hypothetical protein [Amycolatopsis sp. NPDC059657]|uniref:hypothetical protein n=1 Tax=Amycolatopsis sp. NPDC059657 TaxID=3346899 RepID=UPI003670BCC9